MHRVTAGQTAAVNRPALQRELRQVKAAIRALRARETALVRALMAQSGQTDDRGPDDRGPDDRGPEDWSAGDRGPYDRGPQIPARIPVKAASVAPLPLRAPDDGTAAQGAVVD